MAAHGYVHVTSVVFTIMQAFALFIATDHTTSLK
jgi:hypothetical protein